MADLRTIKNNKETIRNPYGRKGKPREEAQSTCDTEESELEVNLVEITEPRDLNEPLNSPHATEMCYKRRNQELRKSRDLRNNGLAT